MIEWAGDRWLVQPRTLLEPPLKVVGAAPITPFEQPLREAAQNGRWILLIVSVSGIVLASLLTGRMTRGLDRLANAADAVSLGALERRVEEENTQELQRLARAFNRMTTSLRSTLHELSEQRARARIGEFAASLAHEVRNPLTAIRVDLQVAEEALAEGSPPLRPLRRALAGDRPSR